MINFELNKRIHILFLQRTLIYENGSGNSQKILALMCRNNNNNNEDVK